MSINHKPKFMEWRINILNFVSKWKWVTVNVTSTPFFPHKSQICLKKQITFSLCLWVYFFVVLSLCHVRLFATPWIEACQTSLVLHCLPEFAQTHVHWIDDAIQPSHPLSSLSPPALNLSQHQGLFQWVNSFLQVAKVLKLQHQSLQ